MNEQQTQQFRKEMQSLSYKKGVVTTHELRVKKLTRWDRDGSHTNAINKAIDELKRFRLEFKQQLKGKTYKEWLCFSQQLSAAKSQAKSAVKPETRQRAQDRLNALTFDVVLDDIQPVPTVACVTPLAIERSPDCIVSASAVVRVHPATQINKESVLHQIGIIEYNMRRLRTLVEADLLEQVEVPIYCCTLAKLQSENLEKEFTAILKPI